MLCSIIVVFLQVFFDGVVLLASNSLDMFIIGFIGCVGGMCFVLGQVVFELVGCFGLVSDFVVLGSFIVDVCVLCCFVVDVLLNIDDRFWVVYCVLCIIYVFDLVLCDCLLVLLSEVSVDFVILLVMFDVGFVVCLVVYVEVCCGYLDFGCCILFSVDFVVMLVWVGVLLLVVLCCSFDFQFVVELLCCLVQVLVMCDFVVVQ